MTYRHDGSAPLSSSRTERPMSAALNRGRPLAPLGGQPPAAAGGTERSPDVALHPPSDGGDVLAVLGAYRCSGGTTRGDDLAQLLHQHRRGDYISLAWLLASGGVFGFKWRHALWIPLFQFEPLDLSPKPAVRWVLSALGGEFDDWGRARWFAAGNARLDNRRPADVIDGEPRSVLDAARADRIVAAA